MRYNRDIKKNSVNDAIREIYDNLYKPLDVQTLITGNILPNSHFEDQTTTGTPDKYTLVTATGAKETTNIWGGVNSVKLTASAAGGYMTCKSSTYPRLLDLMGKTVTFKAWALPQVANDATLQIYTKQADGTEQTGLVSTTANPAGEYTLLELKDQALNDDLVEIEFRFKITTDTKYVIFDNSRATGVSLKKYLLPVDFRDGDLYQVQIQTSQFAGDPCDDLSPSSWADMFGCDIRDDGTDKHLVLPFTSAELGSKWKLRLLGTKPLSTISADTDTIEISGERVNLLIAYAKYKLCDILQLPVSSEDVSRYGSASAKFYAEYVRLVPKLKMPNMAKFLNLPVY